MINRRRSLGFSLIELLIVIAIILIIMTIAIPNYQKAQMVAREVAALQAMRTIRDTEVEYQSQYGRYAVSLIELGPPASGAASAAAAGLIGEELAHGSKQGYRFTLAGNQGGYVATAVPEVYQSSGSRSFYTDQTMLIRENRGPEPPTANNPEAK